MTEFIVTTIFVLLILTTIVFIEASVNIAVQRESWLKEHCIVIGEISGSTSIGTGITTSGSVAVVPIFNAGKTQYKCDDGIIYTE